MLFAIVLLVVLCSLACLIVLHLGLEAVQALLALAMLTITWRLLRRRPGMTLADEFRHW
ncbi:MAG TPA: hypothetical protein VG871_22085 [Vicinamibacterales bacterium]|nr:hypothetical protein [Vicinamibacterales bacterium]